MSEQDVELGSVETGAGPVPGSMSDDQLVAMLVDRARSEGLQLTGEGGLLQQLTLHQNTGTSSCPRGSDRRSRSRRLCLAAVPLRFLPGLLEPVEGVLGEGLAGELLGGGGVQAGE